MEEKNKKFNTWLAQKMIRDNLEEIERSQCEQTVECDSLQSEHSSSLGKGKLNNISVRKQLFFFILRREGH